jgi:peptide-methionine (S)-S-oxide reductase
VSYENLLNTFFELHDPTTFNRQGPDVGTQYRSAIFYGNDNEKKLAEKIINAINESGKFRTKIVTEIEPATDFYNAENYHQDYYKKRGINGCAI